MEKRNLLSTRLAVFLILSFFTMTFVYGFRSTHYSTKKMGQNNLQNVTTNDFETVPNQIVLKFKDHPQFGDYLVVTGLASVDDLLKKYEITKLERVFRPAKRLKSLSLKAVESIYIAHFENEQSPVNVARIFNENPFIEYAEPLYFHHLHATPNDTLFNLQSFFQVIQAEQAWSVVKGEQGSVVIAVADGGTDINHPDLEENLWVNEDEIPDNGLDDDNNGFVDDIHGWNFANNSNDPSGLPNTPISGNHGSQTAGLTAAVTNNITGVSGVSWNARLMPINVSNPNEDLSIVGGYRGILYAADNGADVINLSYGRTGGPSAFEQEVINLATQSGVAVIASAGNDASSAPGYPASYENVLSVAATTNSDFKSGFSNYGTKVDIAAPGNFILSTGNGGTYRSSSGTSFSSPIVAGVAALVKTLHPNWLAIQVNEQVRVTADNIDDINPNFARLLGKGRVNALRAVSEISPSIRITNVQFNDQSSDGIIEPGETVEVKITLKNFLEPASNINLTLTENDNYVTLNSANLNLASLGTLEEKVLTTPFSFNVSANAPSGHPINFIFEMSTGAYQDFDHFTLTILPTFGTVNANNLEVTVTNVGRIGFADLNSSNSGIGFKYKGGPNLLFEGAIIAGTSPVQISNAARNDQEYDDDFEVAPGGDIQIITPGTLSDQESIGIFEDSKAENPMNIRVTQETFIKNNAPNDDFILFRYNVENQDTTVLSNFHFGIFFDWDIDAGSFATNMASYDAQRKLGYAFDTGNGPDTYTGMSILTDGSVSFRAIYNDPNDPGNPSWGLHDSFTDNEKWEAISQGIQFAQAGPADISFVIATGPHSIEPNDFVQFGFALLAGDNLSDIQTNADAAKNLWDKLFVTAVADKVPTNPAAFSLEQNYPNPFNPTTHIHYSLPEISDVHLRIYNIRGQKIRTLVERRQNPGVYSIQWDGKNDQGIIVPSGVYIYTLASGYLKQSRKMLFIK